MTDDTLIEKTSDFLKNCDKHLKSTEKFKKHKEETINSRNQLKGDNAVLFEKVVHKRKKSVKFDKNEKREKVRGIAADFFTSSSNKRKSTDITQKQSEKNKKYPKLELTFSRLIVNDIIHGII